MAERLTWPARVLAVVGLVGVGVAAGVTAVRDVSPELPAAVVDEVADYVVVHGVTDGAVETSVALEWSSGEVLRAPAGWSAGVVTGLANSSGGMFREGDVVVAVDRVERVGLATRAPLVRPLGAGAEGSDVVELRAALERLGFLASGTGGDRPDRWDEELRAAIGDLGVSLGVAPRPSVFDPVWVVWMPSVEVEGSLLLEVGQAAPAAGEAVTSSVARLSRARLTAGAPSGDAGFVVSVDGLPPVRVDGSEVHEDDLGGLGAGLLAQGVDPASTERRFAVLSLDSPTPVARVAAASLQVGAQRTCAWLVDAGLVEVDVIGSQLGVAFVRVIPELPDGARLLADPPAEVRATC